MDTIYAAECPERHSYVIYSTEYDRPDDVSVWCETNTLRTAESVFDILRTHREMLRIRYMALVNEGTGTLLKCDGKP